MEDSSVTDFIGTCRENYKNLILARSLITQALERRTRKERLEYEESYQRIIVRKKARKKAKQQRNNHIFEQLCMYKGE